jgi:PIN domain nuclease of toxin-antitoxin system
VATVIFLDTHVVAWLYAGEVERLPPISRALIEEQDLRFSPVVALELQYLHEIGRLSRPPEPVLAELRRVLGLLPVDSGLHSVVEAAIDYGWTRDPFDRLIAAHAGVAGAPLITADETIRGNFELAVWDSA